MKYIFITLLSFLSVLCYSQINIITPEQITSEEIARYEMWNLDTLFKCNSILYSNHFGEVIIQSNKIIYNSNVTEESKEMNIHPMVFEIINNVVNKLNKEHQERMFQLQSRVYFYETYFGKIIGNMHNDCVEFISTSTKPQTCKDE